MIWICCEQPLLLLTILPWVFSNFGPPSHPKVTLEQGWMAVIFSSGFYSPNHLVNNSFSSFHDYTITTFIMYNYLYNVYVAMWSCKWVLFYCLDSGNIQHRRIYIINRSYCLDLVINSIVSNTVPTTVIMYIFLLLMDTSLVQTIKELIFMIASQQMNIHYESSWDSVWYGTIITDKTIYIYI